MSETVSNLYLDEVLTEASFALNLRVSLLTVVSTNKFLSTFSKIISRESRSSSAGGFASSNFVS